MKTVLRFSLILTISVLISLILFFFLPRKYVDAANVLTNGSFTGGTTGWTLNQFPGGTIAYDSAVYQDSAGSLRSATEVGRNSAVANNATQTISTTIIGGSTVNLNLQWAKQCVSSICDINTISVLIGSSTVWSNTSIPAAGARTAWTAVTNQNISSYFTTTGTYTIQISFNLDNPNDKNAQTLAWVDAVNLDVVPPNVTVGTTGTQVGTINAGTNNAYIGGAFTFARNSGSTSVTSITISELGTIADSNISGLILYYKQEATCSTSKPADATQFNSTPGTFSSGSSTVTGSMTVGTSQICMYVEVDIGSSAQVDDTVEIQITNPSTQVSVSEGTVSPASAVAISGTTTITASGVLSVDIVDGTNTPVSSPSVTMSSTDVSFSHQTSTGTLGTGSEKVYITSDGTTTWQVSIAATGGSTDVWRNAGNTFFYDFNDPTANAEDGGDTDIYGGQLTVNPTVGTLSPGSGCSNTGITLGSNSSFSEGSINAILLVNASSADTYCDWSLTGISLSQSIPKEQKADSYSLSFTLTIAAI